MLNLGHKESSRFSQVYKAAQHAILSGSAMVAAIGLGKSGVEGFIYLFLVAVVVSALLIYALLVFVILPMISRQPDLDAMSIALRSMAVLPAFMFILLCLIFRTVPNPAVAIVWIPLVASVVYGALIGAHLKRLEEQVQLQKTDCLVDTNSSANKATKTGGIL